MKGQRPFLCQIRQLQAKTSVFGSKMRFLGHLGVKMASKHPQCYIRIDVQDKTLSTMYVTWGLRKKLWCSVVRAHNRAPFAHNCTHRSVQRSGRPQNQPKSILPHGQRWLMAPGSRSCQKKAKTAVFWVKNEGFFCHLGVKMASKHP